MKPFISLCMIVKNEEKVLKRCLDSVKDAVDEIIIVDTGSTDSTKEIALNYVDRLYEFEWTNSFSDARNFAKTKASGEWILVMDADEYVDAKNLSDVVESLKHEDNSTDAFEVKIYNFTGTYGERIVQHRSLRLYKNDPSIYYYRTIHEQLIKKERELKTDFSELVLYHSGYLNRVVKEKGKNDRNQELLEKEIRVSGNSGFDYFNLGNEYLSQGKTEEGLEAYLNAYKKKPDFRYSWVSFCLIQIIHCLIELEKYQDALNVISDSESIYSQSPDFKCLKASVYLKQNRFDDAEVELEELINNKEKYQHCVTSIDFLEYHPHLMLGEIHKKKGNFDKAVYHFSKALSTNRYCIRSLFQVLNILNENCTQAEIEEFIENNINIENKKELLNIINTFLLLSNDEIAKKYINKIEDSLIKQGYTIKLEITKGNWNPLSDYIHENSINNLNILIQEGSIDVYDLIVYCLIQDKGFVDILKSSVENRDFLEVINFIFSSESDCPYNKEIFMNLLRRTIQLKQTSLLENLLDKVSNCENLYLPIGHLLYQEGLKDKALKYYNKIDLSQYDDSTFVNLIEDSLQNNNHLQAWQWILYAFSLDRTDYRYFEYVFELILKDEVIRSYDTAEILNAAFQLYPGSARLIYLNSLIQNQILSVENDSIGKKYTVGFFVETTFHYYVYESIINELIKKGVSCHLVINDNYGSDSETSYMYEDLLKFIQHLDRYDIEAYTVSMIKANEFKYDCMVSPYYSMCLEDIAQTHVRAMYGLAKEFWNFSWWNVFYDKILCYGDYDYSRLNIYNNCVIVGNPKFDHWYKNEIPNLNKVIEKFNLDNKKPTLLYAPTYGALSSIDDWIDEVKDLQTNYNVIVKLHHGTALRESEKNRREYIENNFKNISLSQEDLLAVLQLSSIVITDNSGIIFDAMLAEKDILLLNPESQEIMDENIGGQLLRKDLIQVKKGINLIDYIENKKIYEDQKEIINNTINHLIKYTDGHSGNRAASEIIHVLDNGGKKDDNKFLQSLRQRIFG